MILSYYATDAVEGDEAGDPEPVGEGVVASTLGASAFGSAFAGSAV